jgi:hypothetical protein
MQLLPPPPGRAYAVSGGIAGAAGSFCRPVKEKHPAEVWVPDCLIFRSKGDLVNYLKSKTKRGESR